MKELTEDFKDNSIGIEIRSEQEQKKEIKLIGQQRKIPGLILWEYNENTKELNPAKFKKQDFVIRCLSDDPLDQTKSTRVEINENCVYFQALNRKNAERHIRNHTQL